MTAADLYPYLALAVYTLADALLRTVALHVWGEA
jgi:hypothetical protein